MAAGREAQSGVEWRVNVPAGASAEREMEPNWIRRAWTWIVSTLSAVIMALVNRATDFGKKAWRIGADDPRKVIHGVKVGSALTLVSLFYYTRPLYDGVGGCAMWAVMTVVVVFEYSVGGCLYKGLNRGIATSTAGSLALGVHWVAAKSGEKMEPVILSGSVFVLAWAATFSRFIPDLKARFDYGITIFILTFSLVAVSGYRVDELLQLAEKRVLTIAIGISICFLVSILICPVWAGRELHLLVSRNMEKLADSLEGLAEDHFMKGAPSPKSQRYKSVLNSKAAEDSQANLARWEPGHGKFRFKHPWSQYLKLGAAVRHCAYCVEALDACIKSEIQAPEKAKNHLCEVCMRLSLASSKVLKELSSSIKSMKESPSTELLVMDMENAVEELQVALRSFPKCLAQAEQEKKQISTGTTPPAPTSSVSLMEAAPLMAATALLIQASERIGGVVDAAGELAKLACFEPALDSKKFSSYVVPREGLILSDVVSPSGMKKWKATIAGEYYSC